MPKRYRREQHADAAEHEQAPATAIDVNAMENGEALTDNEDDSIVEDEETTAFNGNDTLARVVESMQSESDFSEDDEPLLVGAPVKVKSDRRHNDRKFRESSVIESIIDMETNNVKEEDYEEITLGFRSCPQGFRPKFDDACPCFTSCGSAIGVFFAHCLINFRACLPRRTGLLALFIASFLGLNVFAMYGLGAFFLLPHAVNFPDWKGMQLSDKFLYGEESQKEINPQKLEYMWRPNPLYGRSLGVKGSLFNKQNPGFKNYCWGMEPSTDIFRDLMKTSMDPKGVFANWATETSSPLAEERAAYAVDEALQMKEYKEWADYYYYRGDHAESEKQWPFFTNGFGRFKPQPAAWQNPGYLGEKNGKPQSSNLINIFTDPEMKGVVGLHFFGQSVKLAPVMVVKVYFLVCYVLLLLATLYSGQRLLPSYAEKRGRAGPLLITVLSCLCFILSCVCFVWVDRVWIAVPVIIGTVLSLLFSVLGLTLLSYAQAIVGVGGRKQPDDGSRSKVAKVRNQRRGM